MKMTILGSGWVTPHGRDLQAVWSAIAENRRPETGWENHPVTGRKIPVWKVPDAAVTDAAEFPRLRRSSAISLLAVAAALDATRDLRLPDRTALVFASTDGGVVYTRRFFAEVVARGPGAGSPLLFPETVYNAPASHLAARLGLTGEALTLVGDTRAGWDALHTAWELLCTGEADACVVAAAQELDWITSEAYARWKIASHGNSPAVLSEGAAVLVLGRQDDSPGVRLGTEPPDAEPDMVIAPHAGPTDPGNQLIASWPHARLLHPRDVLGEAFACSSLQEVICASAGVHFGGFRTAAICATGFNGGISALFLTPPETRA